MPPDHLIAGTVVVFNGSGIWGSWPIVNDIDDVGIDLVEVTPVCSNISFVNLSSGRCTLADTRTNHLGIIVMIEHVPAGTNNVNGVT